MQMQPNDLAEGQKAVDRVGRGALLNAGDLMAAEASGPGYLTDAPLASCLARRFADLLGGHDKEYPAITQRTLLKSSALRSISASVGK